jgi:hypothetical protein
MACFEVSDRANYTTAQCAPRALAEAVKYLRTSYAALYLSSYRLIYSGYAFCQHWSRPATLVSMMIWVLSPPTARALKSRVRW